MGTLEEQEWQAPAEDRGICLTVAESIALWDYFQQENALPYWEEIEIARVADKAKMFHKYGPWD